MRLLLMSNGFAPGRGYLEHALPILDQLLAGVRRVAFVPYGQRDLDDHTRIVAAALAPLGLRVVGVQTARDPRDVVGSADAVFVGSGNSFRLLAALQRTGLVDVIRSCAHDDVPYVGSSAGTNVACPSLRTTNDMPIVEPATFAALGLVPFQINPHYPASESMGTHLGETRDQRIAEFLEENNVAVVGLAEGSWLHVDGDRVTLGGAAGARVFQRDKPRIEFDPGADLTFVMSAPATFDNLDSAASVHA